MNVIRHQNVCINDKAIPVPIMFDPLEVVDPVAIVAKNLLALIATDDDMVKRPFELHSRFPRHGGAIYRALEHKSRLRPDPTPPAPGDMVCRYGRWLREGMYVVQ